MLPPIFPGYAMPVEIDLILAFTPLLTGLLILVLITALGIAAAMWVWHLMETPLKKALYPKRIVCPVKHQTVEAQFVAWKGQPWDVLDVERCSGWCLGTEKNCNKECMRLFEGAAPVSPSLVL
ncbi:MAG: hypothetical protein FJ147_06410 [Deltaproteobacteria bacterium]|nr:hypothetical protein [Deltaproteobacteria bacterium]